MENKKKRTTHKVGEPVMNLRRHIQYLQQPVPGTFVLGFDVEFNYIEKMSSQKEFHTPCRIADLPENKEKNRYVNVKPPDHTRVTLTPVDNVPGSDYINANFINGPDGSKLYISAQGPMHNTIYDFWRMTWEHNVYVIVMLTKEVENGKEKCSKYWPDEHSDTLCLATNPPNFLITLGAIDVHEELIERTLIVYNKITDQTRTITHFQYVGWPDHGLPPSTKAFTELVAHVDIKASEAPPNSPIGVHCSAGIGRSGTFCTVHMIYHMLRLHFKSHTKPPPINVVQTILNLRQQRPGMVQTKEQFMFCYYAILDECQRLKQAAKQELVVAINNNINNNQNILLGASENMQYDYDFDDDDDFSQECNNNINEQNELKSSKPRNDELFSPTQSSLSSSSSTTITKEHSSLAVSGSTSFITTSSLSSSTSSLKSSTTSLNSSGSVAANGVVVIKTNSASPTPQQSTFL
eukprot:TRINITY_DN709_c4_g1_i1.p1 TRINITY_DN709_c4_g1~~TRINITY_DN709_c4_g1_i1.p1  ORF type:complete len:464 (-),score=87.43 TRINITY_DN709_c4_g1_i1:350-1741(-)